MILLFGMAWLAIAGAVLCPDTAIGRALHGALIVRPCRALTREGFRKGSAGVMIILFLLIVAAAPELMAVMALTDLTIYFEVITVAMLLGASVRLKAAIGVIAFPVRWVAQVFGRARAAFSGRAASNGRTVRRKASKLAKDPDRGWGPAFA